MSAIYHPLVIQGSDEWHSLRCGMLTASEIERIVTPTLKAASNDKERQHLYELMAQRISKYVEPQYVSDAMLRGQVEEETARNIYAEKYSPVEQCGFITNNKWGFMLGYSPDGLVGADGLIEIKRRFQKYQVQTIAENAMPVEFQIQVQSALLISERKWCDFISYSGGLPMFVERILPDPEIHEAIIAAARSFEFRLAEKLTKYTANAAKFHATERIIQEEIFI